MKRNIDPETVLKNLRSMIEEAEKNFPRKEGESEAERLFEIKEQVQAGFNRLREYYEGLGGRARNYYGDAEERLREYYDDVEERLRNQVDYTNQTLRDHPYRMATVTFGIGLILGTLIHVGRSR